MSKRLSALAQLVAIYAERGITKTGDLVEATGYTDRAIRKARAELECRNQSADRNQGSEKTEPECRQPEPGFRAEPPPPPKKKGLPQTPSKEKTPPPPSSPLTPFGGEKDVREVWLENDQLRLGPGERTFWLEQFGGDGPRLDLALVAAAAYVQPNSFRPLLVQVRAQLARAASDKRDRDSRYAVAAKANAAHRPPDGAAASKAIFDRVLGRLPS
jgi:hypothetical protein